MQSLEQRLERTRSGFDAKAPDEAKAVMHAAEERLRASGMLDRLPGEGDPLPSFALADTDGEIVRSEDLIASGPLAITVYRGVW